MKVMTYNLIKDKNLIKVLWKLSYACNFDCPYCIQHTASKLTFSKAYSTQVELEERAKIISSKLSEEQRRRTMFVLSGGECTLFELTSIIKILRVPKVRIITNGSRDSDYYKNLYDVCRQNGTELSISMSVHKTQQDLNTYIDKISELKKYMGHNCSASLVISSKEDIDFLKAHPYIRPVVAKFAQVDGGGAMFPELLEDEKQSFPQQVSFQLRDQNLNGYNCVGTITIDTTGKWRYGSYCEPWQKNSELKDLEDLNFERFYKEIKCTSPYNCNISCGLYRIYNNEA